MDSRTTNVLSLCAGAGGLELGVRLARESTRVVCAVEIEAYACEVLATRMEEGTLDDAPIWTDLKSFDGRPWRGVVDCVIGGYPCQPFSVAGKRGGSSDPRHLWPDVARIVSEVEPREIFFENVANHLRMGFDVVSADLRRMGYRVAAGLFSAEEVGAPHRRERLFIYGILGDSNRQSERESKHEECAEPRNLARDDAGWTSVRSVANPRSEPLRIEPGRSGGEGRAGARFARHDGDEVADANGRRFESQRSAGVLNSDRASQRNNAYGRSVWPPRPGDVEAWQAVEPSTQPAIRGVADGMAPRPDRLRLTGNGVVPLVAAYAYRTLSSAVGNDAA